jgi:hypothetical protein
MEDVKDVAPEQAMELILTSYRIAAITAFARAVKLAAIVPAPGFLANVAAQRALVAKLGTRYVRSPLSQETVPMFQNGAFRHFGNGREGTDAECAFSRLSDAAQRMKLTDAHDFCGIKHVISKASQKVCSSCVQPGSVGRQVRQSLSDGMGKNIG